MVLETQITVYVDEQLCCNYWSLDKNIFVSVSSLVL